MSRIQELSHKEACEFFGVSEFQDASQWKPYAVQRTVIEVLVQRDRAMRLSIMFGGAMCCGKCGYGIDIMPDGDICPKCGYAGKPSE